MYINDIFTSLEGEGLRQGIPTQFIRFSGCSIHCNFCFGIKPGRRIPNVILSHKPNKQLNKVKIGDKLLTYDKDMNLVETQVKKVFTRRVSSWYEVKIDGTLYYVTEDHPFFTQKGLIKTKDLNVGDIILQSYPRDKLSFSKQGKYNPMRNIKTVNKSREGHDYVLQEKKVARAIKRKKNLGTYIAPWDTLSEEQKEPEENVKKLRKYLKSNGNDDLAWVRVYNYLTGSAFRIGVISHPTITKLSKEVKEYINTIRNKK